MIVLLVGFFLCLFSLALVHRRYGLDLVVLFGFDDLNFYHDVYGIYRNCGDSGELLNCFMPRCGFVGG